MFKSDFKILVSYLIENFILKKFKLNLCESVEYAL